MSRRRAHTWLLMASMASLPSLVLASDHLDAPILQQAGMGDRDVNDLYAFQSPTNSANSVLILTVNPFAGVVNPAGTTSPTTFGADVDYQFEIDNTGDAVPDVTFSTKFGPVINGQQSYTINRNGSLYSTGLTGVNTTETNGATSTAGLFDDPFFFDLVGFNDGFNFVNGDTFAGANVSAIVLELPSSDLNGADSNIGVTARTVVGGSQIDRVGRPAINTAVISSGSKDAFNMGDEADDPANFGAQVRSNISALGGDPDLADTLLPDVLTFDTASPASFLNGRMLTDDVIDAELNLLSGGAVTTDNVDMNVEGFLDVFPYLAPVNVPEPAAGILLLTALAGFGIRRRG